MKASYRSVADLFAIVSTCMLLSTQAVLGETNPACGTPERYDVDGSGVVAQADVLALIDGMNGPDEQSSQFDIDRSGLVDAQDVNVLNDYLQGCAGNRTNRSQTVQTNASEQALVILSPPGRGPYPPGSEITVSVFVKQVETGPTVYLRLAQLDPGLTDPSLTVAPMIWDFTSTPLCISNPASCGSLYLQFPLFPFTIVYGGFVENQNQQLAVPGNGDPLRLGFINVTLPSSPGSYHLDVINAASVGSDFGARLDFGFDPHITWLANQGEIIGGQLDFTVDPSVECVSGTPCDSDGVECTDDVCVNGFCTHDYSAAGTLCGNHVPQGPCDLPDACDGSGICLPNLAGSSTVCRPASDDCDQPDYCSGDSVDCGPDTFAPQGTPCGNPAPVGVCDLPDQCNDAGICSPHYATAQTACRSAVSECDVAEFCTGQSPFCPNDLIRPMGTTCTDDGDDCTDDFCDGQGICSHAEINGCREIPAVSTWGMIVLFLLFAIGAKLRFGNRSLTYRFS